MRLTSLTPWKWSEGNTMTRWRRDPFTSLQREMMQLLDDFFDGGSPRLSDRGSLVLAPQLDVSETDDELQISAEMPGLKEEDIHVEFAEDHLRIHAEKKAEHDEKKRNFHRVERTFGMFERLIPVPANVDRDKAEATYKNGVLTITLPKTPSASATQKIPVKPGA